MWLGHVSPPPPSTPPWSRLATASSSLTMYGVGFYKHDYLGIFGRLWRNAECPGGQAWSQECLLQPVSPVGVPSSPCAWLGNALAWRAGEPRWGLECQALSQAFGWLLGKWGLKLLSPLLQVKDFSFGCAGPAKIILFMCFQALKNSFRAHQWGVNRNFEIRKMPAG